MGYNGDFPLIKMQSWRDASSQLAHQAMPNSWFKQLGIFDLNSLEVEVLLKMMLESTQSCGMGKVLQTV